jgi:hypothetical protein
MHKHVIFSIALFLPFQSTWFIHLQGWHAWQIYNYQQNVCLPPVPSDSFYFNICGQLWIHSAVGSNESKYRVFLVITTVSMAALLHKTYSAGQCSGWQKKHSVFHTGHYSLICVSHCRYAGVCCPCHILDNDISHTTGIPTVDDVTI